MLTQVSTQNPSDHQVLSEEGWPLARQKRMSIFSVFVTSGLIKLFLNKLI